MRVQQRSAGTICYLVFTNSAEESIGRGVHSSPEWFEESVDLLKPLIEEKNQARQGVCKSVQDLVSKHLKGSNIQLRRLFPMRKGSRF